MLRYFERVGVDPARVLALAGLPRDAADDPEARIPATRMAQVWLQGAAVTGDADLGLHTSEAARPGALGLLGYLLLTSETVRDGLLVAVRFFSLLNDGLELTVEGGEPGQRGLMTIALRARPGVDDAWRLAARQDAEAVVSGVLHQVRAMSDRAVAPAKVTFRHPVPATGTREHARIFGVPVIFGAADDAISFDAAVGALPVHAAHPTVHAALRAQADALLATVEGEDALRARARRAVAVRLRNGPPRLDDIGRDLAMSGRSLQRALADSGGSFQDLVDDVRRELATRLLARDGATAAEVALLAGFAEPASFTRAFRRWTGTTPGDWARRARPATPSLSADP
jgi:AraC-like DNA-binding protein